MSFDDGVDKNC